MNHRVVQVRTDALSAEYIYTRKLSSIQKIYLVINTLSIIVPILFSAALLLAKGTEHEILVNAISIVLSVVLLSLVIMTFILGLDQKKENFIVARRSNIYIGNEALKLVESPDNSLEWFYAFVNEMDSKDRENTGQISKKLYQQAHRSALAKLFPGKNSTVCSICNASPFIFKAGSCQVCGNTPV